MFYLSYAEGLSAPRTDNLYAVRRQPDGTVGRPTARVGDHQVLRPRLAPESPTAPSPRWRLYHDRLHESHRVDVRSRSRLQRRPQRRRRRRSRASTRRSASASASSVDADARRLSYSDSELQELTSASTGWSAAPTARARSWSRRRSGPTRRALDYRRDRTTCTSACRASRSSDRFSHRPQRRNRAGVLPWSIST